MIGYKVMKKRFRDILKLLANKKSLTVNELSKILDVSTATIRQDLSTLEGEGFLRRTHGGAEMDISDDIIQRMAFYYEEKSRIAKKAVEFVEDGETLFVEAGSTNALFVRELTRRSHVTVITSNAFIAKNVDQSNGSQVVLIGGVYQSESESLVGNLAKMCIDALNFDKVFIGIDGLSFKTGITGRDMMRSEIINKIVEKGREVFVLTDSSKFGSIQMTKYCDLEAVDHIITDTQIPDDYREWLSKSLDLIVV